jgi:Fe/S biogenesis protein NfuA
MVTITQTAQNYFAHLIAQQEEAELALRIAVNHAGTPGASCDLQFCPAGHSLPDDRVVEFEGFRLYVARTSEAWLEQAEIDFEEDATGGQLTIKARASRVPNPRRGPHWKRASTGCSRRDQLSLASHGGRVRLVEITGKNEVVLQFGGGCHGCGMPTSRQAGSRATPTRRIPEITGVLDATDHRSGSNPYYAAGVKGKSAV